METKFTKGEWKVDDSVEYQVCVISPWSKYATTDNFSTFADYRGALICEMNYNSGVPTKETAVANAKLIAAAPELFNALKELLTWHAHLPPIADYALKAGFEALKKATE